MRQYAPLLTCLLYVFTPAPVWARASGQPPQPQAVRIVSFGPMAPVVVGDESVRFVGTVRNDGPSGTQAGSVVVRLLALAGLEYIEGDTAPKLPALAPGETFTFHWKLQPARADTALVAGMALMTPASPPVVRVAAVQQISHPPAFPDLPLSATPSAWANGSRAWAQNDRIRLRLALSNSGVPMMWLAAWTGTAWQTAGVSLPIAEVMSSEGSQQPWWEVFRAETMNASSDSGSARLVITGGAGVRWRATVTVTLRAGSSVARIDLRLAPLRDMRLSAVRLAALLATENGNDPLQERCGAFQVAAINRAGVTSGGLWPAEPNTDGWVSAPMEPVEGASYRTLGVEARTADKPTAAAVGSLMQIGVRLFAISESETAQDARRIAVGPPLKAPTWAKPKPAPRSGHLRRGRHRRQESHARRSSASKRRSGVRRRPSHRASAKRRARSRR